jgi:hypothetical protein
MMRKLGLLLIYFGLLLSLMACGSEKAAPVMLTGNLSLKAPETIKAGEAATITVGPVDAPDGTPITLVLQGSYGPRLYKATFVNKQARFDLPAQDTRQAGTVNVLARAGNATGAASFTIQSGAPIGPLTPLVGPRAVATGGVQWSMAVVIPFDTYGNPVANDTPIAFRALHPDGQLTETNPTVKNLVAWTRLYSTLKAGRTTVTVTSGAAYGPEATLLEVAGWPVSFKLSSDPETLPADGRQLMTLRTAVIRDQYGNVLPDGTLVTFIVETPNNERRTIPAYTLDGVAQVPLQAARVPTTFEVRADVFGVESESLTVKFTDGPAVGNIPLQIHKDTVKQSLSLEAGPMLGPLQQLIPDGTPVTFKITDSTGQLQTLAATADQGQAKVELRLANLPLGNYKAEVQVGSGQGSLNFSLP